MTAWTKCATLLALGVIACEKPKADEPSQPEESGGIAPTDADDYRSDGGGADGAMPDGDPASLASILVEACVDGAVQLRLEGRALVLEASDGLAAEGDAECPSDLKAPGGIVAIDGKPIPVRDFPIESDLTALESITVGAGRGTVSFDAKRVVVLDDAALDGAAHYVIKLFAAKGDGALRPGQAAKGGAGGDDPGDGEPAGDTDREPWPAPTADPAGSGYVTFSACVDGSDHLALANGNLIVTHRAHDELGKHHECQAPYADASGRFFVGDAPYEPSATPTVGATTFSGFTVVRGRGAVTIESDGSLLIDDDAFGGSDLYVIRIPIAD